MDKNSVDRRLEELEIQIDKALDSRDWERANDLTRAWEGIRDYYRARGVDLDDQEQEKTTKKGGSGGK